MVINIIARVEGREESELAVEVSEANFGKRRLFVARRTDMAVGEHGDVAFEVDDDEANERIIGHAVAAVVGLKIARPRTPKATAETPTKTAKAK